MEKAETSSGFSLLLNFLWEAFAAVAYQHETIKSTCKELGDTIESNKIELQNGINDLQTELANQNDLRVSNNADHLSSINELRLEQARQNEQHAKFAAEIWGCISEIHRKQDTERYQQEDWQRTTERKFAEISIENEKSKSILQNSEQKAADLSSFFDEYKRELTRRHSQQDKWQGINQRKFGEIDDENEQLKRSFLNTSTLTSSNDNITRMEAYSKEFYREIGMLMINRGAEVTAPNQQLDTLPSLDVSHDRHIFTNVDRYRIYLPLPNSELMVLAAHGTIRRFDSIVTACAIPDSTILIAIMQIDEDTHQMIKFDYAKRVILKPEEYRYMKELFPSSIFCSKNRVLYKSSGLLFLQWNGTDLVYEKSLLDARFVSVQNTGVVAYVDRDLNSVHIDAKEGNRKLHLNTTETIKGMVINRDGSLTAVHSESLISVYGTLSGNRVLELEHGDNTQYQSLLNNSGPIISFQFSDDSHHFLIHSLNKITILHIYYDWTLDTLPQDNDEKVSEEVLFDIDFPFTKYVNSLQFRRIAGIQHFHFIDDNSIYRLYRLEEKLKAWLRVE